MRNNLTEEQMKKHTIFLTLTLLMVTCFSTYSQWYWPGTGAVVLNAGAYPSISVVDENVIWVAGGTNTPTIWKSTNGGVNFTSATGTGISLDLFCVWGKSATECYVGDGGAAGGAGGNAKVYKTTDGGATWSTILSTGGIAGFFNGIVFSKSNPNIGFIESDPPSGAGQAYYTYITTNNGVNWTSVTCPGVTGAASAQNSTFIIDAQFFGFGLNATSSRCRLTSNGGTSWITTALGIGGVFVSGLAFSDNKTYGIAATGDQTGSSLPNIGRSTNGGTSFALLNTGTGLTGYGNCKFVNGTNICYISGSIGTPGVVRRSTDNGATWTTMTQTPTGSYQITHLDFYKSSNSLIYGSAVCSDGTVLKLIDSVLFVGIANNNNSVPSDYKLDQNYPNPFNPVTTINYSIPKSSEVKITVYDMLGHEVTTLVNEYKNAGNYSIVFDAERYASGVYYYRITAGDFTAAKKMTLIK
jgi:photosystem II stability/assembly factor-like uncharacterized protein